MKMLLPGALMLILAAPTLHAQVNPRGETTLELSGGNVTIKYGRPSLKGRDIKTMIYPGETWRLGADGDTTLTTEVGLKFGESSVARGTYILRAKFLGDGKWQLQISGTDYSKVAEVPLKLEETSSDVDRLSLRLDGEQKSGSLSVLWGKLSLTTQFTAP
jgi:hypothetical protein